MRVMLARSASGKSPDAPRSSQEVPAHDVLGVFESEKEAGGNGDCLGNRHADNKADQIAAKPRFIVACQNHGQKQVAKYILTADDEPSLWIAVHQRTHKQGSEHQDESDKPKIGQLTERQHIEIAAREQEAKGSDQSQIRQSKVDAAEAEYVPG